MLSYYDAREGKCGNESSHNSLLVFLHEIQYLPTNPENTNLRGSITVWLASSLFCFHPAALLMQNEQKVSLVWSNPDQSNRREVWLYCETSPLLNVFSDQPIDVCYIYLLGVDLVYECYSETLHSDWLKQFCDVQHPMRLLCFSES